MLRVLSNHSLSMVLQLNSATETFDLPVWSLIWLDKSVLIYTHATSIRYTGCCSRLGKPHVSTVSPILPSAAAMKGQHISVWAFRQLQRTMLDPTTQHVFSTVSDSQGKSRRVFLLLICKA